MVITAAAGALRALSAPPAAAGGAGLAGLAELPRDAREPAALLVCRAIVTVWATGALVMAVRLVVGWARLRGVVSRSSAAPAGWQEEASTIARAIGVRVAVRIAASAEVCAPMVVGVLRPTVLVPLAYATGVPIDALAPILAHELAHVRRCDFAINVLQSIAEALLFYHPAVWWVSRSIRVEREFCCDDVAVEVTGDPIAYAQALVRLESMRPAQAGLGVLATGGSLMERVRRFLEPTRRTPARAGSLQSVGAVLAVIAAAALSMMPACGQASDTGAPKAPSSPGAAPVSGAALGAGVQESAAAAGALHIAWLPAELTRFKPEIEAAARRHGIDPALLAIIALVESGGNPGAVSGGGAVGIMQIMPKTAARIAEERGIADYSSEKLREPGYNIDFAAWLLARHIGEFAAGAPESPEAVALSAAAYSAGPSRVRGYVEGSEPLGEEAARYKDVVAGMWKERGAQGSPTYDAFRKEISGGR